MVVSPKIRNERKAISPLSWAISPLDIFSLLNIQSLLQQAPFFFVSIFLALYRFKALKRFLRALKW
jgi:hypothetical protein